MGKMLWIIILCLPGSSAPWAAPCLHPGLGALCWAGVSGATRQEGAAEDTSPSAPFPGCSGAAASTGARSASEYPPRKQWFNAGSRTASGSRIQLLASPFEPQSPFHFHFTVVLPPLCLRHGEVFASQKLSAASVFGHLLYRARYCFI